MAMTFKSLQDSILHAIGDFSGRTTVYAKRWLNDARNTVWEQVAGTYKEKTDYITTTEEYVSTSVITVTVTNASTTVTSDGSTNTAFTAAMVGRFVKLNDTDPWYKIASRTSALEIELADAYLGDSDTDCAFTVNTYLYPLFSDLQELIQVTMETEENWSALPIADRTTVYNEVAVPLRWDTGIAEVCWLDEKDSDGVYQLGLFSPPEDATLVRIRYYNNLTEMSADTDTVTIPGGDAAIKAHAMAEAFTWRNRMQEAAIWWQRYEVEADRLRASVGRSRPSFRVQDHTDASRSSTVGPNMGAWYPR